MANDFFNASGYPTTRASGASASMRAQLSAIAAGFDKMPGLTGNGLKLLRVNTGATALEAVAAIDAIPIGGTTPAAGAFTTLSSSGAAALASLAVAGAVTLGDAAADTLTINPSAVTWANNPTHSGNHTFSGTILASAGALATPSMAFSGASSTGLWLAGGAVNLSLAGVKEAQFHPTSGLLIGDIDAGNYVRLGRSGQFFRHVAAGAGSTLNFDGVVADGTSAVTYQFGRTANTTGAHRLQILRGNGTTTTDHQFISAASGVVAEIGRNGGRIIVGSATDDGTNTLQVVGSTALGNVLGHTLTVAAGALKVHSDGRVSGNKLHNIGTVTGTTDQYIASGTYTPTVSNTFNIAASSVVGTFQWLRLGNVVHVAGVLNVSFTSNTSSGLDLSLPIASNLVAGDLAGSATDSGSGALAPRLARVLANATADTAQANWPDVGFTASASFSVCFSYEVK